MKAELLKTKPSVIKSERNTLLRHYNLPNRIDKLKQSSDWQSGDLCSEILLNVPGKQIVLTMLHKGTEITSIQSKGNVSFQIVEGELIFQSRSEDLMLNGNQILTLFGKTNYRLTASQETIFLLTLMSSPNESSIN